MGLPSTHSEPVDLLKGVCTIIFWGGSDGIFMKGSDVARDRARHAGDHFLFARQPPATGDKREA